jgi:hypothetical protein
LDQRPIITLKVKRKKSGTYHITSISIKALRESMKEDYRQPRKWIFSEETMNLTLI